MAGGGYRGILAAVPPAQRLRSASGKGAADLKPKQSNGKIKRSQPSAAQNEHSRAAAPRIRRQRIFPDSTRYRSRPSRAGSLPQTADRRTAFDFHHSTGRALARLQLLILRHRPPRGRVEVLRSGQPGMDAGLAAPGHGWPMAAGPRSRTGARACRALARHRTTGAEAFGYFALFKVTRRKGGTDSGRYRSNGYACTQSQSQSLIK